MIDIFRNIVLELFFRDGGLIGRNLSRFLIPSEQREAHMARALNVAFLVALAGPGHPERERAIALLKVMDQSPKFSGISDCYLEGIRRILLEVDSLEYDAALQVAMVELLAWLKDPDHPYSIAEALEKTWAVFHPEATGIRGYESAMCDGLRKRRTVNVTAPNPSPIRDPIQELLFTSNVLLTLPDDGVEDIDATLRNTVDAAAAEPQLFWYDHPVPVGVPPENNEIVYGLHALDDAVSFEKRRGSCRQDALLTVVLSASATHKGLEEVARPYVASELQSRGGCRNLNIFVLSETDTRMVIDEVLAPAVWRYLGKENADGILSVFGTHGEYGRHYSFLKAVSALWSVLIDTRIRGTFKFDLDQVFPQEDLVRETGLSAFDHFRTPLWGGRGEDDRGQPLELGMIAGTLVNADDMGGSLFTPDVDYPAAVSGLDEHIFFSRLPQALSTRAEMGARYRSQSLDGRKRCLQRVHVTGGTNGILVDHLRRHRPFTPSFIGRAEDQAYLMSVLATPGPRLAYLHKDGLIMRHDKEVFAKKAIESARMGQLVGDYVRMIYFSWYARSLDAPLSRVKRIMDPFTGSFISKIPLTTAYLRFVLKAEQFFEAGLHEDALNLIRIGAERIPRAIICSQGRHSLLNHRLREERAGWNIFYDALSALETALDRGDPYARDLKRRANALVSRCRIGP
ncbi:MAG: hypothetical protein PVF20_07655 [Desulfobacterales bacterium]|jgi:hypothetical protein